MSDRERRREPAGAVGAVGVAAAESLRVGRERRRSAINEATNDAGRETKRRPQPAEQVFEF